MTFTAHSRTLVLRSLILGAIATSMMPIRAAQGQPTPLAFEVASIKANRSGENGTGFMFRPGGRFVLTNGTLLTMIRNAYVVTQFQVVDVPDWVASERFDIVAKGVDDASPEQVLEMVKSLMADRFKLVIRHETRELPIYALVLARSDGRLGPGLTRSTRDCAGARRGAPPSPSAPASNPPFCGIRTGMGTLTAGGVTIERLARTLAGPLQRIVVDRTGLRGEFDIDAAVSPDDIAGPNGQPDAMSMMAAIVTGLPEQLGLKLESIRGPVDVLVIEHAERPTAD